MAGFAHAFSLSSEEVSSATPPGTVILTGKNFTSDNRAFNSKFRSSVWTD
jgi:hypothetical protein